MSKTTCWTCGTTYEGWKCPTCLAKKEYEELANKQLEETRKIAKEQQEAATELSDRQLEQQREQHEEDIQREEEWQYRQEELMDEAAERERELMEEADARNKDTVTREYELKSEGQRKNASQLYKSGLYDDALETYLKAYSLNKGNVDACIGVIYSSSKLGREYKSFLEKAIKLLTIHNSNELPANDILLIILKENRAFMNLFLDVSKGFTYFPVKLLDMLIENNFHEYAKILFENTSKNISNNNEQFAFDILQILIKGKASKEFMNLFLDVSKRFTFFPIKLLNMLIENNLREYAKALFLSTSKYSKHLLGYAYCIEVNDKTTQLHNFLRTIPYSKREELFTTFRKDIKKNKNNFSQETINIIREKLLERYKEWEPAIEEEIKKNIKPAIAQKERSQEDILGDIIFSILGFILGGFLGAILGLIAVQIIIALVGYRSVVVVTLMNIGTMYNNTFGGRDIDARSLAVTGAFTVAFPVGVVMAIVRRIVKIRKSAKYFKISSIENSKNMEAAERLKEEKIKALLVD